ncbi:MAG: TonB-dependent receptor [Chitinophagaceae bacterium]|nr:TonB-dependent receptor [Chitinophagaceae bacterium]
MRKFLKLCLLTGVSMLFYLSAAYAQTSSLKGRVTDAKDRSPVAGATVEAKGSPQSSAITDSDGSFTLSVPENTTTLVISFVGFQTIEMPVNGNLADIQLSAISQSLNEVVVVGFGTRIKKDLTGNIAKVKGSDVQNMPVSNFNQALQGRAAGVFVEGNSGKVGEGVKVLIRGVGSISASTSPLYVIDGVPVNNSSNSGNPMADINFNDIESFDILKDASAAAIYGSRAANGVVLITTKRGKAGKTNFQVNTQYGFNKPTRLRKFLNAQQYIDLLREAAINSDYIDGIDPLDPDQYEDSWLEAAEGRLDRYSGWADWKTGEINTDWQKHAFNDNARNAAIDISASGGTEKTKFYISASYNNQDGILIGNKFKRLSTRINLDQTVSDKFKIGINLSLAQTNAGRVQTDNEFSTPMQIVALTPVTPFRDLDGMVYNSPTTTYSNPYVDYENGKFKSLIYRNIGNIYGQYNFLPSLYFRTELGADIQNQNDDQFYGFNTDFGSGSNGYGESGWYRSLDYNINNYFNYKKTFADLHDLEAVVGMAYQRYNSEYANVYGEQFPVESLQKLESAALIKGGTSVENNSSFLSYFVRANYKFNDKYLLTFSSRIDGSSVFGNDEKYGFFPAVSAGWILSEEGFLNKSDVISFLKLRGSWGLTGNADGFGNFSHMGLWSGASYNAVGALSPTQLANRHLRWEKSNQVDIGLDFGLFNNRISGEIDLYNRKTQDLIFEVPVPGNSGFSTQTVNIGSMQNKGVEFVINSENISGKLFRWSSTLNISMNKNKILKLDGLQTIIPGNDGRYLNSLMVGQSIGVFYGPKYAGVDPQNGDALYYKADGKTTTNDYNEAGDFIVGNPNPKLIAGLGNTLSFGNIQLSFLFQGVFGNQVMNGAGTFMTSGFNGYDNQTTDQLNRWQKPGDVTDVPQLRLRGANGTGASSRYIYDADYVRLKNFTISYNLSAAVVKRLRLASAKFYITGVNLLTFTDYPGWDPEVNTDARASSNRNQGSDFYAAPQIKNISVGLNIGF